MRKFLVLLLTVSLLLIGVNAFAGGSIYASKVIGSTGMVYDLNLNESLGGVTVFADGKFSSEVDGVHDIDTDKLSGGLTVQLTEAVTSTIKYSEDYRAETDIKILDVSGTYTFDNGFSIKPSIERDTVVNDNKYLVGLGYAW